jgi:hypothetical protein
MKKKRVVWFAAVLILLGGTPAVAVTVQSIHEHPRDYVGREVRIRGRVEGIVNVPLIDVKILAVTDRTGTIHVLTDREHELDSLFWRKIRVIGLNTAGAEDATATAVDSLTEFLLEKQIVEGHRAEQTAERIIQFIRRTAPNLDASLFALDFE